MNTSQRIPKKIHARLLVCFFTILMLFNFIAPTFGIFVAQKSTVVYAQEPPAEGGGDEVSNVPCYDPPKDEGIIDRGLDLVEGVPIVGGGVGAARAAVDIAQDPLKWFVCGVSEMLTKAIDFINVLVSRLMLYDPTKTSDGAKKAYSKDCSTAIGDGGSDGIDPGCADAAGIGEEGSEGGVGQLKSLWRNVLNVVNIVLVLAMLIMVISSALDFGIFSNYTIKKTLPKIVVAAIAANLSWVICSAVITGINYVGIGIQQVMISPLTKNDGPVVKTLSDIALANGYTAADTGSNMAMVFQGPILIGIGGLTWVVFSSMGIILLPLAAIILTAVIVAFVVFLLRRILLILLVMLAPIAFAAWALPGGEGIFKKWWKSFTQLLLIYPYAMILMGAGVVVSSVIGDTGGANFVQNGKTGGGLENLLTAFLMLLAMILPYILLPTAFKAISGVLGTVTGMMNDKGKGLIDRARVAKENSGYYAGKKGAKDAKLAGKKREATAEKVNKYMNGKGLGSRLYKRGMSDSQRGSLQASAENSMIRDITDGHARNNTSGEELSAIIGSSKSSDAEKQAALIRLMQTQDIENISKSKAHLAESEDGVNLFNRTKNQNWDLFSGAGPGAKDLKVGQSKAEIDNEHLAAFKAMPLGDAAKLSQGQWEAYGKINGSQGQAAVSAMYTRVRDYGADDDGDNGKLYPDLKWHDPSYVAPNKRPGGGGTPPTPPAAAAGTGPAPGGGAPTNPPGPGPNPFGGGGATTNPPVPTAAAGGTGPGTVRPSGLWVPNTKPGPAPGGGTPTNPPGPNPPGSNGTPPAGTP